MQFIGIITFDGGFWISFLLGLLIVCPGFIYVFWATDNALIRVVLSVFLSVYIFPFFIVRGWADHRVGLDILAVHYGFFALLCILLFDTMRLAWRPGELGKRSTSLRDVTGLEIRPVIVGAVWFGFAIWFFYFIYFPEHSGFQTYFELNNAHTHPRFSFYDADALTKASFVVFLRLLVPAAIVAVHSEMGSLHRRLIVVCAALLAMQSVERQNLIILIFVLVTVGVYSRAWKSYLVDIAICAASLLLVFVMQGNIEVTDDGDFARSSIEVLFVRIFADPFYMSSFFFETYDGPLLLGTTNRIFGYLGFDYAEGLSAIGLLPDLLLNWGLIGYFVGALYFAGLLGIAVWQHRRVRKGISKVLCFMCYVVSLVGLFYSNSFSLVPAVLYAIATIVAVSDPARIRGGRKEV